MARLRVLAIAVASGRVGYVYLFDGQLQYWAYSKKASKSPDQARKQVKSWIALFKPDVVVTEKVPENSPKGEHAKGIIAALSRVAEDANLLDVVVTRIQKYKDKYVEARALAKRFSDLKAQIPREPKIWQSEPRGTIVFEALAMALVVIDKPEPRSSG